MLIVHTIFFSKDRYALLKNKNEITLALKGHDYKEGEYFLIMEYDTEKKRRTGNQRSYSIDVCVNLENEFFEDESLLELVQI